MSDDENQADELLANEYDEDPIFENEDGDEDAWREPGVDERIAAEIESMKTDDPGTNHKAAKNYVKEMLGGYLTLFVHSGEGRSARFYYLCRKTLKYAEDYGLSLDRKNGFYPLMFSKSIDLDMIEEIVKIAKKYDNMSELIRFAIGCNSIWVPAILDRELRERERCAIMQCDWDGKREYFIKELALRPPQALLCFYLAKDEYIEWSYPFIRHFGDLLWSQGTTKTLLELGHPATTEALLNVMGSSCFKATDYAYYQALITNGANPKDNRVIKKARQLGLSWLLLSAEKRERLAAKYGVTVENANSSFDKSKKKEPGPSKELWVGALLRGNLKFLSAKCKIDDCMLDARIEQSARIESANSTFYATIVRK
jgi:hypothetical protein